MLKNIKITKNLEDATVITHGGIFHADDVLSTVILSKVMDNVTVLRTFKVPANISDDVLVYDIGFGRFDHHQKGGNGTRKNGVPYAACGLLWKEFGHKIVGNTCNPDFVWSLIDKSLIQSVDASDNGTIPHVDYVTQDISFSSIISNFNPCWNSTEDSDEAFLRAVAIAYAVFENALTSAISKAQAREIIDEAIEASCDGIMVLKRFAPWQTFLFNSTNPKAEKILFVVFPSRRETYNWQCVAEKPGGFKYRKPVPDEWKGIEGPKLQKITGVATAIFCHPAGFIGGAETLEDAIALAKLAAKS